LVFLILFYAAPSLCFAGLDNELFYMDKTMMVFGDAKKVIEDMVKAVE
jgi:NAD(P) transhydrogenase subunit beta